MDDCEDQIDVVASVVCGDCWRREVEVESKTAARGGLAFCALAGVKGSARASKS